MYPRFGKSQVGYHLRYLQGMLIGFQCAQIVDQTEINAQYHILQHLATIIRSGKGLNLDQRQNLISRVMGMTATEYEIDLTQLRLFEKVAQAKLFEFVANNMKSKPDLQNQNFVKFLLDGELGQIGNLEDIRYQKLRMIDHLANGKTEQIELTAHDAQGNCLGYLEVIRANGHRMTIEDYLKATMRDTLLEILASASNYIMVDPDPNANGIPIKLQNRITDYLQRVPLREADPIFMNDALLTNIPILIQDKTAEFGKMGASFFNLPENIQNAICILAGIQNPYSITNTPLESFDSIALNSLTTAIDVFNVETDQKMPVELDARAKALFETSNKMMQSKLLQIIMKMPIQQSQNGHPSNNFNSLTDNLQIQDLLSKIGNSEYENPLENFEEFLTDIYRNLIAGTNYKSSIALIYGIVSKIGNIHGSNLVGTVGEVIVKNKIQSIIDYCKTHSNEYSDIINIYSKHNTRINQIDLCLDFKPQNAQQSKEIDNIVIIELNDGTKFIIPVEVKSTWSSGYYQGVMSRVYSQMNKLNSIRTSDYFISGLGKSIKFGMIGIMVGFFDSSSTVINTNSKEYNQLADLFNTFPFALYYND